MSFAFSAILASFTGFIAHLLRPVLKRDLGTNGLFYIASYVVGSLIIFPFHLVVYGIFGGLSEKVRVAVSYLLSCLFVGIGVVVGFYVFPDED